jgi:hypothetical protein
MPKAPLCLLRIRFPESANSRGLNAAIRLAADDFDAGTKRNLSMMISTND